MANPGEPGSDDDEARELHRLVLLMRQYGEKHPEVLSAEERLADIFYSKEKFKDAAPIYRRLTQVMKDTSSNPLRAAVWFKLARTYEHLNQSSEANECYENAVELAKTTIGPLFPNLLESFLRFLKRTNAEKDRIEEIKALIENLNR